MAARLIACLALYAFIYAAQAEEFVYTEADNSGNRIALGFSPPQPVDTTVAGNYFRSYDFLRARHQELLLQSERMRQFIAGPTWKGEDLYVYRLGDVNATVVDDTASEGAVLINGGIHAREWQTQEAVTGLMEYLVGIQDDTGLGSYLADNLDIYILPVHNIDGFRQTQRFWNRVSNTEQQPRDGRMRRKNMHAPDDSAVDELLSTAGDSLYGIDLNRNGAHGFGLFNSSSSQPGNIVYHGTMPASEPETRALLDVAQVIGIERLRFFEDVHSFSQLMYVPQTGNTVRDGVARELAQTMTNAVGGRYDVVPDPVGGHIGTMADYFAYQYDVPAWTLELEPRYEQGAVQYGGIGVSHDGFILPESEVARLRSEFNSMHLAVFYEMSGPAIVREVAIRRVADGEPVYAAHWHGGDNARSLVVSTDTTLLPNVEYELWLAFSKPMHGEAVDGARRGSVQLVNAGGSEHNLVAAPQWLAEAGETFAGYHRYRHDAFRATFTLPNDLPQQGAERRMLLIDAADFAGRLTDADPATIAGFAAGRWTGYERFPGVANTGASFGNADCNFMISVGRDAGTLAPAGDRSHCRAYLQAGATPPGGGGGGGGGGALHWLLLALTAIAFTRRPESAAAARTGWLRKAASRRMHRISV